MKFLRNQKGILAFDFLFGIMIMTGFFILVVMLSFTLSVVESIQYIAFATSRTYYAADENEVKQREAAELKYEQLKEEGVLKSLLKETWFDVEPPHFNSDSKTGGVRIDFTAKSLSFTLPFFLGRTGDPSFFRTNVNSYIGREPSMKNCMDYNRELRARILTLNPDYQSYSGGLNSALEVAGDNGC